MVHVAHVKVSKGGISNSYTMDFPPVRHARVPRVGGQPVRTPPPL